MNWWAVVVAAIANVIVGSIYYAPPVMGNTWLKLLGKRREQMGQPRPGYALVVVSTAVGYIFEKRPFSLFAVNAGSQLVILLVMGAILGVWK
jgi:hypothetical protein